MRILEVRFQHWDRAGNGYLRLSDLEEAARRVGEAFGRAADSRQQVALDESCRQLWRTLARHADVDLDGRISQHEYVAAFGTGVLDDPDAFDRIYRALLENVVIVADANGDDKLNKEEFLRLMRTWYTADESDGAEAFRRLDRDGDGFLTLGEMVQATADLYFSDNTSLQSLRMTPER
jgi:Ca2+-binding EF-hand superfamily protein